MLCAKSTWETSLQTCIVDVLNIFRIYIVLFFLDFTWSSEISWARLTCFLKWKGDQMMKETKPFLFLDETPYLLQLHSQRHRDTHLHTHTHTLRLNIHTFTVTQTELPTHSKCECLCVCHCSWVYLCVCLSVSSCLYLCLSGCLCVFEVHWYEGSACVLLYSRLWLILIDSALN